MNTLLLVMLLATVSDPRIKDAERLAAHGELDAARAQYQALHDELAHSDADASASLHYNLGTLALSTDDVGDAVVHLLAAHKRAPFDDDVRHNLEAALNRRADQVEAKATTAAIGARIPSGPVSLALGIALTLLGLALALTATSGRPQQLGRRLVPATVALGVLCGLLFGLRRAADATDVAVVIADTQARPQPDPTAAGFQIHPGLTGQVIAEQEGFFRLRLENGVDVWVNRTDTRVVP